MNYLICVVAYKRIDSISRLIKSLIDAVYPNENKYDLWISIDHSDVENIIYKKCQEIEWTHGVKKILKYEKNLGLKAHVLKCISYVEKYDGIFLLEDDLLMSKCFPIFIDQVYSLNDGLVAGTALYSYGVNEFANLVPFRPIKEDYDAFLMKVPCSWGEFWTKQQGVDFLEWLKQKKDFDYDSIPYPARLWGEKSWKKDFYCYLVENDKYIIYPYYGLSTNMSETGVHNASKSNVMQSYMIDSIGVLKLPCYSKQLIRYDQYMESELLKEKFNDTTIDIYGVWKIENVKTRYILSSQLLNYKCFDTWDLSVIPFEMNVIKGINGEGLFLYDLSTIEKNKRKKINFFMSYIPYVRGNWFDHAKCLISSVKRSFGRKIKRVLKLR